MHSFGRVCARFRIHTYTAPIKHLCKEAKVFLARSSGEAAPPSKRRRVDVAPSSHARAVRESQSDTDESETAATRMSDSR